VTAFDYLLFTAVGVMFVYEIVEWARGRHNIFSKIHAWLFPKRK